MFAPDHPLRRVRERAGLSLEAMAALVGSSVSEVAGVESGPRLVEPEVLERYAVAFGMSARDLLAGEEPSAVALLFRGMQARGAEMGVFAAAQAGLGEFVRCVRDLFKLRGLLGENPEAASQRWLETIQPAPLPAHGELHAQARKLAAELRALLGLTPDEPIASMRRVIERLGIVVRFVEPEQLDRQVEGAALLDPYPAILVNLVGGGAKWWRTRMILAHELCHLLHDRTALDAESRRKFFLFSPYRHEPNRGPGWRLIEHFEGIEARANAFAGDLLAPTEGVRRLIGASDPGTLAAIRQVCVYYMVGPTTALNRLQNTFGLSREQRRHLETQVRLAAAAGGADVLPRSHPDAVADGAQLRDAEFVATVLRAMARGHIDGITAREYLQLRLSDPLPAHPELESSRRTPLVSAEQRVTAAAQRYLFARTGKLFSVEARQAQGGWSARVYRRSPDGQELLCGELRVRSDLAVDEPVSWLAATSA